MSGQPQLINLDNYRPNDLQELHNNIAQELQLLSGNLGTLKLALSKYKQSKEALVILKSAQQETRETLIPLTSSLYIPGVINEVKSVLVDIGTGYYAEKDLDAAIAFCDTKIEHVSSNVETVQNAVNTKREDIAKIRAALQRVVESYNTKTRDEAQRAGVI